MRIQKVPWNFKVIFHCWQDSVCSSNKEKISFFPTLILSNDSDNTLWFWHRLNLDFCVPWYTIVHILEEDEANGNIYCMVYYACNFKDIHTSICFFENPSLHIHVLNLCMNFSIYEVRSNVHTWMHTFLQTSIYKSPITAYSKL